MTILNHFISEITADILLIIILLIPLVGIMLVYAFQKYVVIRDIVAIIVAICTFLTIFQLFFWFIGGHLHIAVSLIMVIENLAIIFQVTSLGMILALTVSFLWVIIIIYAIGYMRSNQEKNQTCFLIMLTLSLFFVLCIAFAGNLFTLFFAYELLIFTTYILVVYFRTEEQKKAGRTYLGILLGTSISFLLPAIIITYNLTETISFAEGGVFKNVPISPSYVATVLTLFVYGFSSVGFMPFHRWIPSVVVAPTIVNIFLYAVVIVPVGIFCITKIAVYVLGIDYLIEQFTGAWWHGSWIVYVAGATVILAAIIALKQDNLKKRLAYVTLSHASYGMMTLFILSKDSIIAASFYIAAYSFATLTLFCAVGAIYTASGKEYISQLKGIGKRMPWTMTAFAIGAFSMIAIPPTAGFITKWYMLAGALDRELWYVILIVLMSTMLNVVVFLPIIYSAFFEQEDVIINDHQEAPYMIVYPLSIAATFTIWLFFMPDIFMLLSRSIM